MTDLTVANALQYVRDICASWEMPVTIDNVTVSTNCDEPAYNVYVSFAGHRGVSQSGRWTIWQLPNGNLYGVWQLPNGNHLYGEWYYVGV